MNDRVPEWQLSGEYVESCNCELLCPCIVGPRTPTGGPMADPTEGHCDVLMVFRIERGHYGSLLMDELHAALAIYTPGPMGAGNWTFGLYVDEAGSKQQQEALAAIVGGAAGGPFGRLDAAIAKRLPLRTVPITFEADGRRRRAEIPGVLEIDVEGIKGADGNESWLENVSRSVSTRLAIAKASVGTFRDHELDWNNNGRNGHYSSFDWSGP